MNSGNQNEIVIRYGYTDGKNWIFHEFDIAEIENGMPYEAMIDNALLKHYKLTTRDRWTGLTDKNGVKVFENDVCRWPSGNINKIIWTDTASFSAVDLDTNKNGRHGIVAKYIEVIGNIHNQKQ